MVKVVIKAMRILEEISRRGGEAVRLSDLADALGENATTVAGIVKTLTDAGYLQKDPVRGYRLGVLSASLVHGELYDASLLRTAQAVMPSLACKNGLYMSLAVLRNNVRHSVLEVNDSGSIVMQYAANPNVFSSATGLMLAAHQPRSTLDALLEIYTLPRRFRDNEEFIRSLYMIRAEGFVELARPQNRIAIAVPILRGGSMEAALGCFPSPETLGAHSPYDLLGILRDAAAQIAARNPSELF
ncbi:MAG: helix-turn-helix domain-containing protein [Clostridiaceae bacterium]|nr:helix-turn-helix domain-containing protein [Clostridiaceae bacterium]